MFVLYTPDAGMESCFKIWFIKDTRVLSQATAASTQLSLPLTMLSVAFAYETFTFSGSLLEPCEWMKGLCGNEKGVQPSRSQVLP